MGFNLAFKGLKKWPIVTVHDTHIRSIIMYKYPFTCKQKQNVAPHQVGYSIQIRNICMQPIFGLLDLNYPQILYEKTKLGFVCYKILRFFPHIIKFL